MTYPLGSAHLSTGKMHSIWILWEKKHCPLGSGILSSEKTAFYPRGKGHGYTLVSGTLSSGISTRGDRNTTLYTTETSNCTNN